MALITKINTKDAVVAVAKAFADAHPTFPLDVIFPPDVKVVIIDDIRYKYRDAYYLLAGITLTLKKKGD